MFIGTSLAPPAKPVRLVGRLDGEPERVVERADTTVEVGPQFAVDRVGGVLDESRADTLSAPPSTDGDGVDFVAIENARAEGPAIRDGNGYRARRDALADVLGIDRQRRAVEHVHHCREVRRACGADVHGSAALDEPEHAHRFGVDLPIRGNGPAIAEDRRLVTAQADRVEQVAVGSLTCDFVGLAADDVDRDHAETSRRARLSVSSACSPVGGYRSRVA